MNIKHVLTGLLSFAVVLGIAGTADAKSKKRHHYSSYQYNSPSAIAERQRHASTFDSSHYFEHDSTKIPMGALEWWNQKAREGH